MINFCQQYILICQFAISILKIIVYEIYRLKFKFKSKTKFSDALLSYSKLCCADWEGLDEILDRAYKELKKNISSIRPFTYI